jgi:hypothetical protein
MKPVAAPKVLTVKKIDAARFGIKGAVYNRV